MEPTEFSSSQVLSRSAHSIPPRSIHHGSTQHIFPYGASDASVVIQKRRLSEQKACTFFKAPLCVRPSTRHSAQEGAIVISVYTSHVGVSYPNDVHHFMLSLRREHEV